jgi:hypothetical protein
MEFQSYIALGILSQCLSSGQESIKIVNREEGNERQKIIDYRDIDYQIRLQNKHEKNNYTKARERERKEIEELINKGCKVDFYNNFIVVNGKTFNGWDINQIKSIEFKGNQIKISLK